MESMTNIPYYITKARFGGYKYPSCPLSLPQSLDDVASLNLTQLPCTRYGDGKLVCGMQHDGLWDPYNNHHMGLCAEKCSAGKLPKIRLKFYKTNRFNSSNATKIMHFLHRITREHIATQPPTAFSVFSQQPHASHTILLL